MAKTTTPTPHAAPSAQDLKAKQTALEHVRAERAKLDATMPALAAAVNTAREALDRAQLSVFTAKGTPGYEDDVAAEASVRAAQGDLDAVCTQRDAAEERLGFLERAEAQLDREAGEIQAKLHLAHLERQREKLRARIATGAVALADMVRDVTALRALDGLTTWPEELARALEQSTPTASMQHLVREGHDRADRIRAGEEA